MGGVKPVWPVGAVPILRARPRKCDGQRGLMLGLHATQPRMVTSRTKMQGTVFDPVATPRRRPIRNSVGRSDRSEQDCRPRSVAGGLDPALKPPKPDFERGGN